jgi:small conductance mechanosensitive channel
MKKRLFIIVIVFIAIFFAPLKSKILAQSQKSLEEINIEIEELEKTISLLENPKETQKLATQLKGVLEAKKQLIKEKGEIKKPKKKAINLFDIYKSYKAKFLSPFKKAVSEIKTLPLRYKHFKTSISEKEYLEKFWSFCLNFLIALLISFSAWFGLYKAARKLEKKIKWKVPLSLPQKIASAFIATFFKLYPWIGLYLFSYFFFLLLPLYDKLSSIILYGLFALIVYYGLKNLFYFLLSPQIREKRVIPIKDELSNYIFIWWRRIIFFSLLMYFLIMPSSILDMVALMAFFCGIYKVGLVLMVSIILAQWKDGIEKAFSLKLKEEDPDWKNSLKTSFNYVIGKLYIVVILFLGLIVTLSILGFEKASAYLVYKTVKSFIILFLAFGLWLIWGFLFNRIFQAVDNIKRKYPEFKNQINLYINFLGKLGYLTIILFTALLILNIWGLNIYKIMVLNFPFIKKTIEVLVIIVATAILVQISLFFVSKLEKGAISRMLAVRTTSAVEVEKRVSTLGQIFRKVILITIVTIAVMMIFAELGFDIKPILAGAGVVGLAVGFGAQSLVRDVISGLFLIVENRVRVGDVAIINGTGGSVEQLNLRTTVLRSLDGTVHVFPNGGINSLSNMTHDFSYYIFDVGVAYKEDVDKVIAILKEIGEDIMKDQYYKSSILEPLEVLGVDQFADSAIIIKARIKTLPIKQWEVGREINRRIKKRFDEVGIEIPFPHRSFYFGEASKPISIKLEGFSAYREELKKLIREVLEERKLEV